MSIPLSLVVSTLGRTAELRRLFESLRGQEFGDFETIVVDQNDDDRLSSIIADYAPVLALRHLRTVGERGLSRGRNAGWRHAAGEILLFPDDDCWYPPWFLRSGMDKLYSSDIAILSGRSADQHGRSINARFARSTGRITRRSVWTRQMEWTTFIRRSAMEDLGGYDESLGIGALTPWQAAEGPDLILRALEKGMRCYFDPTIVGHHDEIETIRPEAKTIRKARSYARGMGFVLRNHRFGTGSLIYWVSRSLANTARHAATGEIGRARFYFATALGRLEGWANDVRSDV